MPGAYDPETKLYIFGTGNPTPAYTAGRGEGDNLFTCSLVAVNVDTGKMAWYYQTSPHDTHDWDSAQTPVLVDGDDQRPARASWCSTAARNGYFFTLDRVTGEQVATSKYGSATNWATGLTAKGGPQRNPIKDASVGGAIVSPTSDGIDVAHGEHDAGSGAGERLRCGPADAAVGAGDDRGPSGHVRDVRGGESSHRATM